MYWNEIYIPPVTWVILLLALAVFLTVRMPAQSDKAARLPDAAVETLAQAEPDERHKAEERLPSQLLLGRPGELAGKAPCSMTLPAQPSRAAWQAMHSTALNSLIQRKLAALHARTLSAVHRRRAHTRA